MKKFSALLLALVLCLSLSVPASAAMHDLMITDANGEQVDASLVKGFTNGEGSVTMDGVNADLEFTIGASPTIILAPGSKNVITSLIGGDSEHTNNITIKGSGELIIYNPNPNEFQQQWGAFHGMITSLKLEDGLTMTGGVKPGDNRPLSIEETYTIPENGIKLHSCCMPDKNVAWYIRIAPAGSVSAPAAPAAGSKFTDVAVNSPYEEAINWAVEKGITKGTSATAFSPNAVCTEGQIVTFLYRAAGSPKKGSDEWSSVVNWTYDSYIPYQQRDIPCTRINAIYYMWMAQGQPASNASVSFTDVSEYNSAIGAVRWAVEKGITTGTSPSTFSPDATCTRGQIVTFLYRAMK